jgi:pimeloyl-ACP methyl ester carboxylesterase
LQRDDVVRLSPPGFGAPLHDGFAATYLTYRDWLEEQLEALDQPIDLVGHDWGGGHVVNVVMHRPELVRSWVSDAVGLFDANYVWHDLAQVWQTPGEGEQLVDTMLGYIGSDELRRRAADRAGARTEVLDRLGHWWMVQDPARGAAALTRFWDAIG